MQDKDQKNMKYEKNKNTNEKGLRYDWYQFLAHNDKTGWFLFEKACLLITGQRSISKRWHKQWQM